MLNTQPIEKQSECKDGTVEVVAIWETIQGEGPFAGEPALFIRLAGCNLQCPLCDTDYTSGRQKLSPREMAVVVKGIRQSGLVVLTGGEPFRQSIAPAVGELLQAGFRVQIETNGTLWPADRQFSGLWFHHSLTVVCSPKTPKVHAEFAHHVNAWKYVVQAGQIHPDDGLPMSVLGAPMHVARPLNRQPVYIQPLDEGDAEKNAENMRAAADVCLKYGYRLSLQLHKIVGLE